MSRPPNTFLIIYLFDWFRLRRNAMADAPYEDRNSRRIARLLAVWMSCHSVVNLATVSLDLASFQTPPVTYLVKSF